MYSFKNCDFKPSYSMRDPLILCCIDAIVAIQVGFETRNVCNSDFYPCNGQRNHIVGDR